VTKTDPFVHQLLTTKRKLRTQEFSQKQQLLTDKLLVLNAIERLLQGLDMDTTRLNFELNLQRKQIKNEMLKLSATFLQELPK
jgi:hypothetical protein